MCLLKTKHSQVDMELSFFINLFIRDASFCTESIYKIFQMQFHGIRAKELKYSVLHHGEAS